ncbi:MAG TPA: 5-oxoprolinase subunit PxpB [Candidatus Limnocylindrales bacterium]|nr:5-oxoprolinase subunit PxpB [Candidatus Limnocylindrales bacterium]
MTGAVEQPRLPSVEPFGEAALLVTLGDTLDVVTARRAQALATAIRSSVGDDPRWADIVPAAASVLVRFDPLALEREAVRETVARLATEVPAAPPRPADARTHAIRVAYGGEDGPDLAALAAVTGMRVEDVIDLHASEEYEVAFLGFAPGFAYLLSVPDPIALPRLATPRPRVPRGSVGIAGRATGIYPAPLPGGWRLIGRTDAILFDPLDPDPVRLRPGDAVRFEPR